MAISIIVNIGTVGATITNVKIEESATLGGTYTVISGQTNVLVSSFPVTVTNVADTTTYIKITDLGSCGDIQTLPIGSLPRPDAFQFKATSGDGSLGFAFDPTMWAAGEYDAQLVYAGTARSPDDNTNTQDNATTIQPLQLPLKVAYNPLNNQTVSTGNDATKELLWQIYTTNNDPLKFPGFSHAKFANTLTTPDIVWRYKDITNWGTIKFKYLRFGQISTTAGISPARDGFIISDTNYPDLTRCTDLSYCFSNCGTFNDNNVIGWDVSNVENMTSMFKGLSAFDQDIGSWNMTGVTRTSSMFAGASAFNQDMSSWVLSNLETPSGSGFEIVNGMFNNATAFNNGYSAGNSTAANSLNSWKDYFANQLSLSTMFSGATAFNSNITEWDVSSVQIFNYMFYNATNFNQDLSDWDFSAATDMSGMFQSSGMSSTNYGLFLQRCAALGAANNLQSNVSLGASGVQYPAGALTARNYLVNTKSWTINDSGQQ